MEVGRCSGAGRAGAWALISLALLGLLLLYNPPLPLHTDRWTFALHPASAPLPRTPAWLAEALGGCVGAQDVVVPLHPALFACPGPVGSCLPQLSPPLRLLVTAPALHCLRNGSSAALLLSELRDEVNYWRFRGAWNDTEEAERGLPKLTLLPLGTSGLSFPEDPVAFNLSLASSVWRECNRSVAESFKAAHPDYFEKKPLLDDSLVSEVAHVRDLFLRHGAQTLLFGGTLLGWYRECGLIPYTTDLDLAARAADYSPSLERSLVASRRAKLYWILGAANDSLELSVHVRSRAGGGRQKVDVFFLNEDADSDWVGGMIVWKREKLRWDYPRLAEGGLCSAELLGELFWVPCDVEGFLRADYGPDWHRPAHDSTFLWYKDHSNVRANGHWSRKEWPSVYRTKFGRR